MDGVISVDVTLGNANLTFLNGDTDQSRNRVILITNNSGTSRTVTIPDVQKLYFVRVTNGAGSSTKITNSSDITGVTITDANKESCVLCNGSTTALFLNQLAALLVANNLSDLADKAVARTNLEVYSKNDVDSGLTGGYPVGSIVTWPGATPPTRHLLCQGQAVSRTTYSAVFAIIGTTYGAGDGASTFNLPDLRGEFVRGFDATRGVDPGRALGSAQADMFRSHTNEYTAGAIGASASMGGSTRYSSQTFNTAATGGTETRPRNVAMNYAIYTGVL